MDSMDFDELQKLIVKNVSLARFGVRWYLHIIYLITWLVIVPYFVWQVIGLRTFSIALNL